MEKIVFKNYVLNIVVGIVLITFSFVGYFMGWFDELLAYFIAAILLYLSVKRFIYSFKKVISKNATLILTIELALDVIFVGLMIYLQDYVDIFMGLVIYTRGVSYLIINYVATRKIKLVQYIFNIGYVTIGAYFIFGRLDDVNALAFGLGFLALVIGAIYLQHGLQALVKKEEAEEVIEKQHDQIMKDLKKKHKEEEKELKDVQKSTEKLEQIKKQIKDVEADLKPIQKEMKKEEVPPKVEKPVEKPVAEPAIKPVDLNSYTVVKLKEMAKEKDIKGASQMTKAELVTALKQKK